MKILLAGTFLPISLELSYERAFQALGCEVGRFDLKQVSRLLEPFWKRVVNQRIFKVLNQFKPDLILVVKGYYLWPRTIQRIQELKKYLVFCFNGDSPFNLIFSGASNKNILNAIPHYDCYLIWTGAIIGRLYKSGARKAERIPFGFDSRLHHPLNLSAAERDNYGNDIAFVGNWDKEREVWLREIGHFDLGIWGEGYWKRRCKDKTLRSRWRKKAMYGEGASLVLNSSKISLNILRNQNKGNHNMRTFEAPACGAFVLAERSPEALEFFQEDKEAVYFSSPEELREKSRYYLQHEEERKRIAQAGYQRCIRSGYSYLDRAKKILEVYNQMRR